MELTNCKAYANTTYLYGSSWNFNEYVDLSDINPYKSEDNE